MFLDVVSGNNDRQNSQAIQFDRTHKLPKLTTQVHQQVFPTTRTAAPNKYFNERQSNQQQFKKINTQTGSRTMAMALIATSTYRDLFNSANRKQKPSSVTPAARRYSIHCGMVWPDMLIDILLMATKIYHLFFKSLYQHKHIFLHIVKTFHCAYKLLFPAKQL